MSALAVLLLPVALIAFFLAIEGDGNGADKTAIE